MSGLAGTRGGAGGAMDGAMGQGSRGEDQKKPGGDCNIHNIRVHVFAYCLNND